MSQPSAIIGEGLVIHDNGLGYYAWLRSLLIDCDWDFDNEFDEHATPNNYVPPPAYRTDLGRRANQWSIGPACVWAWIVVPSHFLLKMSGLPWEANGYSLPYQLLVGATSLAISGVGLLFLYGVCRHHAGPRCAALTVTLVTLGSTIVYYGSVEVSMAHGFGTTTWAMLVWYWQRTYGSMRPARWLIVGILVGGAALMRWQLACFALLPAGEVLLNWRWDRNRFRKLAAGMVLAVVGAVFAFLPQMIAWRCVFGHWLTSPIPQLAQHWLYPSWWQILFSQDRSLFYWTPITMIACAGAVALAFHPQQQSARLLVAAFALQVYLLASVWGKGDFLAVTGNHAGAHLSHAFGMRHLTESVVTLAPGMAFLLERISGWRFRLLTGLGLILVFWNLLLILQYSYGWLPSDNGLGPKELLANAWQFAQDLTGTCLLVAEGLGVLWLLLAWGRQPPEADSARVKMENPPQFPSSPPHPSPTPHAKNAPGLSVIVLLIGCLGYLALPEQRTGFMQRIHRDQDGRPWKYTLFVPAEYRRDQPSPLLVYLHGYGSRGADGITPTTDGPGPVIKAREKSFEMLVLFPQSETGDWQADTPGGQRVMAILEEVVRDFAVDRERIYLTGTSMGGYGVWSLAANHPDKWAAIVPICGGGDPASIVAFKHLPCWCFHGARDNVIDVRESRRMIEALQKAGASPRYTEYPEVGHACWSRAYADSELWDWLRRQRRPGRDSIAHREIDP